MDIDAFKSDLDRSLKTLPPEVLSELSVFVLKYKDYFANELPKMFAAMQPHVMAGGLEWSAGILDIKEVEGAIMEVLGRHGGLPKPDPVTTGLIAKHGPGWNPLEP